MPLLVYLGLFQKDTSLHSSLKTLGVESWSEGSTPAPATP